LFDTYFLATWCEPFRVFGGGEVKGLQIVGPGPLSFRVSWEAQRSLIVILVGGN
jgi:hypothetical protein